MEARLRQALARAEEVARALADPETARNPAQLKQLGREHARLDAIRQAHSRLEQLQDEFAQAREVLQDKDPELSQLARAHVERLRPEIGRAEALLADLLTPADPLDDRDAIVEIRAGTGGDEAALFAADLFRMYTRYCERRGWKVEVLALSEGNLGGLKEAIFAVRGPKVYGTLRYESGVHRVQRIPETETQGRRHTSAATVAVLAGAGAAGSGGHGRPIAEDPHIQLSAEPDHRPPHRVHGPRPRRGDGREARRADRGAQARRGERTAQCLSAPRLVHRSRARSSGPSSDWRARGCPARAGKRRRSGLLWPAQGPSPATCGCGATSRCRRSWRSGLRKPSSVVPVESRSPMLSVAWASARST